MQSIEDKIISDFLRSVGLWKEHVVIGGGFAPVIYQLYLVGEGDSNPPVGTRDIDTLIHRRVSLAKEKSLASYMQENRYQLVFRDVEIPATEAYKKEIEGVEFEVEFPTDNIARKEKNKNVLISGVTAQPLSYLDLSLKRSVSFQTYSSIEGKVVSPGAWIFHKGLTFPKRRSLVKRYKDLYGIWYVISELGALSLEAYREFKDISKEYSKWFMTLSRQLETWVEEASPKDWEGLELQDPWGRLKKEHFIHKIAELKDS